MKLFKLVRLRVYIALNKLEKMRKEMVVVTSQYFPEEIKKKHRKPVGIGGLQAAI
jgi:hypothetical protein